MDFEEFESKEQKDFEIFMMRYKAQYRDFSKIGDFTYSNELTSIAYDAYLAGQQSKQADIDVLKAKIDDAFLENAKLKHVIDQVKLHNGSLGFRSMQRMIEELLK